MTGPPEIPPPTPGPPPGWYPDPYGGAGYRWWDGSTWTEHAWAGEAADADRLLPVGDLLGQTFRLLGQRLGHLFTLAVVLVLPIGVLSGAATYAWFDGVVYQDGRWTGISPARTAVVVGSLLLTLVLYAAYSAAVSRQAVAAASGSPEPWSRSLVGGLRRSFRVIVANLAVWSAALLGAFVLVAGLSLLGAPGVLLGLLGVAVVGLAVWVLSAFVTTAAAVAPAGRGAIRTSVGLARPRAAAILGRLLVLALMWWAVQIGGSALTGPVASQASAPPEDAVLVDEETGVLERLDLDALVPDNVAVMGFGLVAGSMVLAAARAVTVVGRACLYQSLDAPVDPALLAPDA